MHPLSDKSQPSPRRTAFQRQLVPWHSTLAGHPTVARPPGLLLTRDPVASCRLTLAPARHSPSQFLASTRDSSARTLTMSASAALATPTSSTFPTDDKLASPAMFGDNDEEDLTLVAFA